MLAHNANSNNILFNKFLYQAQKMPDKIAVHYNDSKVSYSELEKKIYQIAAALKDEYSHLFQASQSSPILIGVKFHSKLDALCCEIAILALGAIFVPFDFSDAKTRQEFMIKKSGISLMLTDDDTCKTNDLLNYCCIPSILKNKNYEFDPNVYSNEISNALAYVLFTSGSTSENPKGVMRSRKSLFEQMTRDYKNDLKITENDCLLNLAIFSHDQAIVDCFAALLNGCTLCLYDPKNMNVNDLHSFMNMHRVTIFSSIPSMFSTIFENINDKSTFPHLRIVTLGGEETLINHALLYQKTCPDNCVLINGYGATEISWIASYTINHQTDLSKMKSIPLGYLTKSASLKLIPYDNDDNDISENDAPIEKLYELCIASDCLSSGYLGDKNTTSKAFFSDNENTLYYRTGDIVKLNDDQCIDFLGRASWYEKINGKRIDMHEIENVLRHFFKKCAIIAYDSAVIRKKIYAFYTHPIDEINLKKIKIQIGQILEKHMVPCFRYLNEMPTLANGKIDRQSLRKILKDEENQFYADLKKMELLQTSDNIEEIIEGYWRYNLEIPLNIILNPIDTFADLGGDSKCAIQLANQINYRLQTTFNINIKIDPFVFVTSGETFPTLCQYVTALYKHIKQQNQGPFYPKPWMNLKEVRIYKGLTPYTGCYSQVANKYDALDKSVDDSELQIIKTWEYDYTGLQIITHHVNKLYNIQINLCETKK